MSREAHVRFWESAGVRFPRATRLLEGLRWRAGRDCESANLRSLLQFPTPASSIRQSDTCGDLLRNAEKGGELRKTGHAPGRPCWRSSFVGHPRAKCFPQRDKNKDAAARRYFF